MRKIYNNFKALLKKIYFESSILSILLNPAYFVRKGLWIGIKENSHYMHGKMLDFGCGSKPYKKLFNVAEYIGLDIEVSGHQHTNEEIDVFYNGKTLPFSDCCFDSFFSSQVFEHVENLDDILNEIHRVLKKDSYLLITAPLVWGEHEIPYDFGRFTSYGMKHLLENHGFNVAKLCKSTNYVEAVFQMWAIYISSILPRNKYLHLLCSLFFIAPSNLLGYILSRILPKKYDFYNDNIVVAQKQ